jgi:hypothetical protein
VNGFKARYAKIGAGSGTIILREGVCVANIFLRDTIETVVENEYVAGRTSCLVLAGVSGSGVALPC